MAPTVALGAIAREAKQCQHCFRSETEAGRLLSCSACHRAHYCNKECQTADWPNHKVACKLNRQTRDRVKAESSSLSAGSSSSVGAEPNARDVEDALKPWRQIHKPVFNWAHSQALDLYHHPENVDTLILQLRLKPAFTGKPSRNADQAKLFHLEGTDVISFNDTVAVWSEKPHFRPMLGQLGSIQAQSEVVRKQGGTGVGIVLLLVGRNIHVVPCGYPDDLTASKELYHPDWEQELANVFKNGMRF
ncbi:hypothetical protein DENSPDRAFT_840610 [Dentipellis sp. KUC8613]|nr:hypothetical protein DENSPDRAFT_840610 [Dentipellis sp. KUC8613]